MKGQRLYALLFAPVLFVLAMSVFQTLYASVYIAGLMEDKANREKMKPHMEELRQTAAFIRDHTRENEPVLILMDNTIQSLLYDQSGTRAAINPGFNELYMKADYERILGFLRDNAAVKVFFDPQSYEFADNRVPALLSSYYSVAATQPGVNMLLLEPKKPVAGGEPLLSGGSDSGFHLRLDDPALRYKYCQGDSTLFPLGQQFTFQVLFRPDVMPNATLTNHRVVFTNSKDSMGGFDFHQYNEDATNFIFSFCGVGMLCPVTPGEWNYITVVYDRHDMAVYAGGELAHAGKMGPEYRESDRPSYVGNYRMQESFFFGDIREMRVSRGCLTAGEIRETWDRMQGKLK
jgi:hypothetical protein